MPSHLKMNYANSFIVCNYEAKNSWPAQILMGWVKSAVGWSREEHGSYCKQDSSAALSWAEEAMAVVHKVCKYILQFGQIHFAMWTNTFSNLNKYICQFGQTHFAVCTNTTSYNHITGQLICSLLGSFAQRPQTKSLWRATAPPCAWTVNTKERIQPSSQ